MSMRQRIILALCLAFAAQTGHAEENTETNGLDGSGLSGISARFITPSDPATDASAVINSRLLVVTGRLPQVPPAPPVRQEPASEPAPAPVREVQTVVITETRTRYIPYLKHPKKHHKKPHKGKKSKKSAHQTYTRKTSNWSWADGVRAQRLRRMQDMGRF